MKGDGKGARENGEVYEKKEDRHNEKERNGANGEQNGRGTKRTDIEGRNERIWSVSV